MLLWLKIRWLGWIARQWFVPTRHRLKAVQALEKMHDPGAGIALQRVFLKSCERIVRLGGRYDNYGRPKGVYSRESEVRTSVVSALDRLDPNEAIPVLAWQDLCDSKWHGVLWDRLRTSGGGWDRGSPVMSALLRACTGKSSKLRPEAVRMLQQLYLRSQPSGPPAARAVVRTLRAAARSSDSEVREAAIKALRYTGHPLALRPLAALLRDHDGSVRYAAITALGEIGDPSSIEPLRALLDDAKEIEKNEVIRALGRIGGPAVRDILWSLLSEMAARVRRKESVDNTGWVVANVLAPTGDPRAFDLLLEMIHEGNALVAIPLITALDPNWVQRDKARSVIPVLVQLIQRQYDPIVAKPLDALDPGWQERMQPDREENLQRWVTSGRPEKWVSNHHGRWDDKQWLALLEELRQSEFWPLEVAAVGRVVDAEKLRLEAWRESRPRDLVCLDTHAHHAWSWIDTYKDEWTRYRCERCGREGVEGPGLPRLDDQ